LLVPGIPGIRHFSFYCEWQMANGKWKLVTFGTAVGGSADKILIT